jgi:hypothetical protein
MRRGPGNGCGINIIAATTMINTNLSLGDPVVYGTGNIFGIAAFRSKLYVSEWDYNQVEVFDLKTPAVGEYFPGKESGEDSGRQRWRIWVSQRDPSPNPATAAGNVYDPNWHHGLPAIDHYDADGKQRGHTMFTARFIVLMTVSRLNE